MSAAAGTHIGYRREIDGLRALAVLSVIVFHAGFAPASGGFAGVDVFFVISGYLITSIIVAETASGSFTLSGFYERRARRILPALFVMLVVCLPMAWVWLLPQDMNAFAEALIWVSLFASNIFFWRTDSYFGPDAELNPLLHTWSLAVEEQYYLIYPVVLAVVLRAGKGKARLAIALAAVLSLAGAQWLLQRSPSAAFYLLPTRAWELMIGGWLAMHAPFAGESRRSRWTAQAAAAGGIGLILYAVFAFDRHTPFPGVHALAPALGAALLIRYAGAGTLAGRLLGARLPVGLGLISYSAYLWHQPLFAFARHASAEPPGKMLMATLVLLTIVIAYFSWKYVERPFRKGAPRPRPRAALSLAAACSAAFLAFGLAARGTDGFPERVTSSQRDVLAYRSYAFEDVYRDGRCLLGREQSYAAFAAECQGGAGPVAVLVWGDSHAAALSFGLRQVDARVVQYTASGCPPLKGLVLGSWPHCTEVNEFVMSDLRRLHPEKVVLHANWYAYRQHDLARMLGDTIASVRRLLPDTDVIVVGPVPQWAPSLPVFLSARHLELDREYAVDAPLYDELRALEAPLQRAAEARGAKFVSALAALCQRDRCAATTRYDGKVMPTMWDYGHLTSGGSVLLAPKVLAR